MKWLTWDQALGIAAISAVVVVALRGSDRLRRRVPRYLRWVEPAAVELGLIWGLYALWRLAARLPFTHTPGAMERAFDIWRFEQAIHMPSELTVQHFIERNEWIGPPVSYYYAYVHVPSLMVFLVWLFIRHRDRFPHWRNGLVLLTAGCLVMHFVRVAPPRFFPELGFIDLGARYGPDIYGPIGTGVSDQFAAMPSIHVGWAAVVSFGTFAVTTSRWRWLVLMHVFVTQLVVSGTANHWWMDGIVAVALLWIGLKIDTRLRAKYVASRMRPAISQPADPEPIADEPPVHQPV